MRPEIIRADTIDLQNHQGPSAKDHSRQPTNPAALGAGPAAPHQAEAQRDYAAEQAQYQNGAWEDNSQLANEQYDTAEHATSDATVNGNSYGQERHVLASQNDNINVDQDGDADEDSMDDDDMMDKISSSPSIDDGGSNLPPKWPSRSTSLSATALPPTDADHFTKYREPSEYQDSEDGSVPSSPPMLQFLSQDPGRSSAGRRDVPRDMSRSESLLSMNSILANNQGWEDSSLQSGEIESYDDDFASDGSESEDSFVVRDPRAESDDESDDMYFSANMETFLEEEGDPLGLQYESSSDEEEEHYEFPENVDPRYILHGWASECLQRPEDIDFEFVYALHTFVATVEGQANATKGDTMVLLDDSNSYWWLVRVVKDSSIGYLPAEHIETPTERLARLNKHRNIDLSASHLADQEEKQDKKNPIVKAITKRKTKNVTFNSVHNYVEASDVEYSSDEDEDNSFAYPQDHDESSEVNEDEIAVTESERAGVREVVDGEDGEEVLRASSDSFDGPGRSRNGTVRNTDSFFKDDTVETRKITITPNLLRDDSATATRPSVDITPLQGRVSLDKLQKDTPIADKSKEKKAGKDRKEKESKEKKPGMLSGLFKRKDKKRNLEDEDPEELIMGRKKDSRDSDRTASPEKMSLEMTNSNEDVTGRDRSGSSPQRHHSKLQKSRSGDNVGKLQSVDEVKPLETHGGTDSIRTVQSDDTSVAPLSLRSRGDSVTSNPGRTSNDSVDSRSTTQSSLSKILHRSRSNSEQKHSEPKPEKTRVAKQRVSMDADSDSEVEEINHERFVAPQQAAPQQQQAPAPVQYTAFSPTRAQAPVIAPHTERVLSPVNKLLQRPIPGAFPDSYASTQASTDTMKRIEQGEPAYQDEDLDQQRYGERLSESPIEIYGNEQQEEEQHSHMQQEQGPRNPFASPPDLTTSYDEHPSPSSSPSPELIEVTDSNTGSTVPAIETSGSGMEQKDTWNDANLREFFDDGEEVRDLLVVVYDKTGVEPAGADHPVTGGLFKGENARLMDMTNRLDNMLGDWLARKRSSGGPR